MDINMDSPQPKPADPAAPFDAFKALAGKIIQVPKAETDAKEAAYQQERAKEKAKGSRKAD